MSADSGIASLTSENHAWKCETVRTQEALSGCGASRSGSGTLIQENMTCMLVKGKKKKLRQGVFKFAYFSAFQWSSIT